MNFYISKTDFKIGTSCPRKLWYKKNGYPTTNDENEYMQYLAKGGYIVGKMAQLIYAGGIDISEISNYNEAVAKTKELIQENENIILYEAAVYANQKLARIDILEKKGKELRIIEVKAKSQSSDDENEKIPKDYLNDVLFQVLTTEEAYPEYQVKGYLFLPDKSKMNQIEGLAGWFIVEEDKDASELDELPARSSGFKVPTVKFKYEGDEKENEYLSQLKEYSIMELRDIKHTDFSGDWAIAKNMVKTSFELFYKSILDGIKGKPTKDCKSCEFSSDVDGKNGFKECWHEYDGKDLSALELYYGGAVQQGKGNYYLNNLIDAKTTSLKDIDVTVLTKGKSNDSLSARAIRQLLQIEAAKNNKEEVRYDALASELSNLVFPLHFIDFETFTGAIPFHAKMRPYELIAFQWSCHTLHLDGTIEHFEWINLEDTFPNFRFAESLMKTVGDVGTPLMWSHHENTVLKHVLSQIEIHGHYNSELISWLEKMTHDRKSGRTGKLVDMAKICESTYIHPDCRGKVSIKKILPVIWGNKNNTELHENPLFQTYFKLDDGGKIVDPYKTLSPVKDFLDTADKEAEDVVAEGTAAMRAYFDLMYGIGRDNFLKKQEIKQLLLQYCKLDTLAMVIIYSYWKKLLKEQTALAVKA